MFSLATTPIDAAALRAELNRPEVGALVVFEGVVRDHHQGRAVVRLEYEAFAEMAGSEGAAIVAEVEALFPGVRIRCVHRTGTLAVGEMAVWIGVAAPHRGLAFAGCRAMIEQIKRRLPVWKKEHFAEGEPVWVNCVREQTPERHRDDYHRRHVALPEIGPAGQQRLAAARVLVVGLGGLGCAAAEALVGAGVGTLDLLDGGAVEWSNLHRQTLYTAEEVGLKKAPAAAHRLSQRNPFVQVRGIAMDLLGADAARHVSGHDLVLDCTDNFVARFHLHDAALAQKIPVVQAAGIGFAGMVNTFGLDPAGGCLRCLWPGASAGALEAGGDCAGGAVFGPAIAVLGLLQATEAIHLLLGQQAPITATRTLLVDWRDYAITAVQRSPRPDCGCRPTAPSA